MNPDLKYIYPISRVGSIERLLKVTAHNAFFVVTPLSTSTEEDTTSSIGVSKQSPLLYERRSIHPIHRTRLIEQRRRKEALKRKEYKEATINDDGESRGATPFSSGAEEGVQDNAFVFHGLILRSQLVELLRNRIFFDENLGVSTCTCKLFPCCGVLYMYMHTGLPTGFWHSAHQWVVKLLNKSLGQRPIQGISTKKGEILHFNSFSNAYTCLYAYQHLADSDFL